MAPVVRGIDRPATAGLDAAVALAYRLGEGVGTAVAGLRRFVGEHLHHGRVQVRLEGQDIVRPAGAKVGGDRGLAAPPRGYPINRHEAALQLPQCQQPGDGRDRVGLGVGLAPTQDRLGLRRPGADHVPRGHPQPAIMGAACGLAVAGDHLARQQGGQ